MATSIFVAQQHLKLYKSGYPTATFRGERIHTEQIDHSGSLHAVFPMIEEDRMISGGRDFTCLYLKNEGLVTAKGIILFSANTKSSQTHMRWGVDPVGVGDGISSGKAQEIPNRETTPTGIFFRDGTNRTSNVTLLPDLPKGKVVPIWFERSNVFNGRPEENDNIELIFDTVNVVGDTGIVDTPGTSTNIITGGSDVNIDLDWLNRYISLRQIIDHFFFLGNATNQDDPTAWIQNMSKFRINNPDPFKNFLKDILSFIFGKRDVTTNTKRNQIINGVDSKAKSGYQMIIDKNVAWITIDTSGFQAYTNPSAQYDKIKSYLDIANQHPQVDFKVILAGTSMYGQLPGNEPDNNIGRLDSALRNTYHQLFIDKRVHLVIGSSFHNYQRTHILGYNALDSESPSTFFTGEAPHYEYAEDVKDFGNTGCMFINIGTAGAEPIHSVPDENIKSYVHKTFIPLDGPCFLEIYAKQRTVDNPSIMEGRLYQFARKLPSQVTSQDLAKYGVLKDQWSIKYHAEPPVTPGED